MFSTKVITDESQVPKGYISMVDVRNKYGETVAKRMSDAHKHGKVPAVKLMRTVNDRSGNVWVDMRAWEESQQPKPAPEPEGTPTKNDFWLSAISYDADRMVELLEAILKSQVETLACMQRLETAWASGDKAS